MADISKLDLLLEAEKRGILPPEKQSLLDEARKRGLLLGGPATPTSPPQSFGDAALQVAGQGARAVLKGASYPITAAGDILAYGYNKVAQGANKVADAGLPSMAYPGEWANNVLDANFPQPQTPTQRVASNMTTAAVSAPGTAGMLVRSGWNALVPMAEAIGSQIAGAASAAGAGSTVREVAPGHPWLEFMASLAGGALGGLAASVRAVPVPQRAATLDAFNRSGITPSAADIRQTKPMQTIKNALSSVPLAGGVIQRADEAQLRQAQQSATNLVNQYGAPASPSNMGAAVQNAAERYRYAPAPAGMTASDILRSPTSASSIAAKAGALYDRVPIGNQAMVQTPNSLAALRGILSRFQNPELAQEFNNPTLIRWNDMLARAEASGGLSWGDLRNLRTELRYMRNDPTLAATVDDRALAQLNQALSQDMVAGAQAIGGPRAAQLVARADDYYGRAMTRINDSLQRIFRAPTAENAFGQVETALLAGKRGDIAKVSALRRALTDEEWGDVAATVLDRMGTPKPGQAPAPGSGAPNFSVNTFLTNYSQMDPAARSLLFAGSGRADLRDALDDLTRALGAMKTTASRGNPSGTATTGIGLGALVGMATAPRATGAMLGTSYLSARAMYWPPFVHAMARTLRAQSPSAFTGAVQGMANLVRQRPDLQSGVDAFLSAIQGGQDQ